SQYRSCNDTNHYNLVSKEELCMEKKGGVQCQCGDFPKKSRVLSSKKGRRRALIYEFMPNGSLEKFIYDRGSSSKSHLGREKLHQIAIGIARGLEYLHRGCNTRVLHFDIKPHNILLDQNMCPKILDFGLAKLFPDERSKISMSHMRGTPGYIAKFVMRFHETGTIHVSTKFVSGLARC
ncbi:protein kinase-like domain, concanavalin A-like lectin/glucanase domain protein, partial [Tanacetum coccineum]